MYCKKCGSMVKDGSRFCHKCGAEMPAAEEKSAPTGLAALADYSMGAIRTDEQRKTETAYVPDKTDKADKPREADLGGKKTNYGFISSDEEFVAKLGNNYLQSFAAGKGLRKGSAIVSSKRVYFKGTCYNFSGGRRGTFCTKRSAVVDLHEVTGTEIIYGNKLIYIILLVIFAIGTGIFLIASFDDNDFVPAFLIGLGLTLIDLFLLKKHVRDYISINYSGGAIAFNLNWYSMSDVVRFQEKLHIAKDKLTCGDTEQTNENY